MGISAYSTTPGSNGAALGIDIAENCAAGNINNAIRQLMADIKSDWLETGTVAIFLQPAAPTGWTKSTTHDDKALRIVSGTPGSGGTVGFTTAFGSSGLTTDVHVLSAAELPAHQHFVFNANTGAGAGLSASTYPNFGATGISNNSYQVGGDATVANEGLTSSIGSGTGHSHTMTLALAVKYADVIACVKT